MEKVKRPIRITDTTLRDAHQSLWATRMHIEDILPIAEKIDEVGYNSIEVWGGATLRIYFPLQRRLMKWGITL